MRNWLSFIIIILKLCWLAVFISLSTCLGNLGKMNVGNTWEDIIFYSLMFVFSMIFWFVWLYRVYVYDGHIFKIHRFLLWIWIKCDDKTIKKTTRFKKDMMFNYEGYKIFWSYGFRNNYLDLYINDVELEKILPLEKINKEPQHENCI